METAEKLNMVQEMLIFLRREYESLEELLEIYNYGIDCMETLEAVLEDEVNAEEGL